MSDKIKDGIYLFNMSNYVKPDIVENWTKKYVLYGKNNEFFDYINDRYNGSPTNESVINVYCELLYGRGIAVNGSNEVYKELSDIFPKREQKKCLKDFKKDGQYAMQILRAKGGGVAKIMHIPFRKLGMEKMDDKGVINNVYYSEDFSKANVNPPKKIPVFNGTLNQSLMIKLVQPYTPGQNYFANPDYLAGLQYAELEEEISNYSINHIKNGLSFGYVINMNNGGALDPEQKDEIEYKIKEKLTGSTNAGKFIISFNDSKDTEVTVVPLEVNEAHSQWEFLSREAMTKILTAHGVTSPLLFGLPSAGGFGANAEELDTASKLLQDYQINPKQEVFIDELAPILELNNLETDLVFIPLRKTYGTETEEEEVVDETVDTEETEDIEEVEMSKHFELFDVLDQYALDEPEGYELTDGAEYDLQLSANQTSEQDSKIWKIRYKYVKGTRKIAKSSSRAFCLRMLYLAAKGKVFRKEDIDLMSMQGVNGEFAHSGGKYDIFKFGGGVNCHHRWERRIFKKRLKADGTPKGGGAMQQTDEVNVNEARRQGAKIPKNDPDVAIAEIDKPRKGRY